jgi:kynurenine formamidase
VEVNVIHEMIRRGIRTFLIDALNIDAPGDITFPVHHAIANVSGILGENLANVDAVDFPDPLIIAFPLRIVGSDGSPVRAVAISYQ